MAILLCLLCLATLASCGVLAACLPGWFVPLSAPWLSSGLGDIPLPLPVAHAPPVASVVPLPWPWPPPPLCWARRYPLAPALARLGAYMCPAARIHPLALSQSCPSTVHGDAHNYKHNRSPMASFVVRPMLLAMRRPWLVAPRLASPLLAPRVAPWLVVPPMAAPPHCVDGADRCRAGAWAKAGVVATDAAADTAL